LAENFDSFGYYPFIPLIHLFRVVGTVAQLLPSKKSNKKGLNIKPGSIQNLFKVQLILVFKYSL